MPPSEKTMRNETITISFAPIGKRTFIVFSLSLFLAKFFSKLNHENRSQTSERAQSLRLAANLLEVTVCGGISMQTLNALSLLSGFSRQFLIFEKNYPKTTLPWSSTAKIALHSEQRNLPDRSAFKFFLQTGQGNTIGKTGASNVEADLK